MDWRRSVVSADRTHHLVESTPLYEGRFIEVLKFHEPGLAPVRDASGAFHIGPDGRAAYPERHLRTFGFYEGLAAVSSTTGWFHVTADGTPAYAGRWAWCGNFMGGRVPARTDDGRYRHLDREGRTIGTTWRYAGDFRDGVAVVQGDDGRSTHVDLTGALRHGRWFADLDVFHKDYARARDDAGWTHVDGRGEPIYGRRFAMVEPFYNGQARVERFDGALEIIDERGARLIEVRPSSTAPASRARVAKILLVGLPGSGKTAVGEAVGRCLGLVVHRLDDLRWALADGTVAGDYLARSAFLRACRLPEPGIYEFSATGYHRVAVRQAFREAGDVLATFWIDTPSEIRKARLARRQTSVPLPDWGIAPAAFDVAMASKLSADFEGTFWEDLPGWRAMRLDGARPIEELAEVIAATWRSIQGTT